MPHAPSDTRQLSVLGPTLFEPSEDRIGVTGEALAGDRAPRLDLSLELGPADLPFGELADQGVVAGEPLRLSARRAPHVSKVGAVPEHGRHASASTNDRRLMTPLRGSERNAGLIGGPRFRRPVCGTAGAATMRRDHRRR